MESKCVWKAKEREKRRKCLYEFQFCPIEYSYETANGISADETGILKQPDDPAKTPVITVQGRADLLSVILWEQSIQITLNFAGKFSYTAPDGTVFTVTYVADDVGGFQPQVTAMAIFSIPKIHISPASASAHNEPMLHSPRAFLPRTNGRVLGAARLTH